IRGDFDKSLDTITISAFAESKQFSAPKGPANPASAMKFGGSASKNWESFSAALLADQNTNTPGSGLKLTSTDGAVVGASETRFRLEGSYSTDFGADLKGGFEQKEYLDTSYETTDPNAPPPEEGATAPKVYAPFDGT